MGPITDWHIGTRCVYVHSHLTVKPAKKFPFVGDPVYSSVTVKMDPDEQKSDE